MSREVTPQELFEATKEVIPSDVIHSIAWEFPNYLSVLFKNPQGAEGFHAELALGYSLEKEEGYSWSLTSADGFNLMIGECEELPAKEIALKAWEQTQREDLFFCPACGEMYDYLTMDEGHHAENWCHAGNL